MSSDRSRTSDDLRQHYKGVVTQQGRVILDRDFNAMQGIFDGELAADATDIIGPCGTPDDGFEISLESSSSPPNFWSPPFRQDPSAGRSQDFLIAPGTMYIGGQRAVFPARFPGQTGPFTYSYFDQPDWINPPAPEDTPSTEVAYLRLFEQEVGAVEDPDLLEVALGGPDSTQRVRLMRRVQRCPGSTCTDAAKHWHGKGFRLDPKTMRLLPEVALQASYATPASVANPCDPIVTGGYLGAFNQLIRVETRNPKGGSPFLLWGYDNASFLYRVTADGQTLTLAQAPVDAFHQPANNQVVEVLRTAAVLAPYPDATDAAQSPLRCVAEAKGFVTNLQTGYSPNADGSGTVVLASSPPLPADYASDTQLFLRIWQGQTPLPAGQVASDQKFPLTDFSGQATGLLVQLTATGKTLPHGAFWMIAVRPSTPQEVYPERFLMAPQPPDGPNQWMCPLAVIDWTGGSSISSPLSPPGTNQIVDCRAKFCNLVGLTKRERTGCCTFRVGNGGDFSSIQEAINNLPAQGGEICVLAGRYFEELTLVGCTDVVIHGCGPDTRIASPSLQQNGPAASGNPVISTRRSRHLELRSLAVEADQGSAGIELLTGMTDVIMQDLIVVGVDQPGISIGGNSVRLERSTIALQDVESGSPAVFANGREIHIVENWVGLLALAILPNSVQTDLQPTQRFTVEIEKKITAANRTRASCGIQIGGDSSDVYVCGNEIQGGRGNGITLGSLRIIDNQDKLIERITGFYDGGVVRDPCSPGNNLVNTTVPPDSTGQTGRVVVEGPLLNIHLEHNRIRNMGLAGIGPVGFFALQDTQEIVSITRLSIIENEISHCPSETVAAIADADSAFLGYAAIALPDVADLVLRDNLILNTGAALSDPVCGIFLLHGEQVEISRNQIVDQRDWSTTDPQSASGLRAGISILMVTPPQSPSTANTYVDGVGALSIFDNVIQVPVGVILSIAGLGAFSIRSNQLTTGGLAGAIAGKLAAGVAVFNFGTPIEAPTPVTTIEAFLTALENLNQGASFSSTFQLNPIATSIEGSVGTGPVLFSQNRCYVQLSPSTEKRGTPDTLSSVFILTFDDLGFHDNQCGLVCSPGQGLCDALLIGPSVRATSNRVQEKPGLRDNLGVNATAVSSSAPVLVSLVTLAFGNVTALNVCTNRILALGIAPSDFTNASAANIIFI